jgi:hypothetical protein
MGTRAMIKIDGKPIFATHWDGNPEGLGEDLKKARPTIKSIMSVAKKHIIDFADKIVLKELQKEREEYLVKKHKLPIEKIKKGIRRGFVVSAEDYDISDISHYDDWAEYEYDINTKTGEIKVRSRTGSWKSTTDIGKWETIRSKDKLKKVI